MARVLDVFLSADLVGRLRQDDSGALSFAYTPEWLAIPKKQRLSASLPLRAEPFNRNECRPFFAGLLPEETSRQLIAKSFGISDRNDFALLEKIGGECAGAVSLMPTGEHPMADGPCYHEINMEELRTRIAQLPKAPLLAGQEGIRLSLAGAQGKLVVAIFAGRYSLPQNGSPSTHIIKPQGERFDGLVENEFFCMKLAAMVGLEVAPVAIGNAGGLNFLQIERYDRDSSAVDKLERWHQEDFCQAMGVAPELKYQQEGGPNLKKCFELVRSESSVSGPDILRLFDAVVYNFLIGNNDAHGKNFSFLYQGNTVRLAPLYDLVCTQAYPELAPEMAMKIGDERNPERVSHKNWLKLFKDAGVNPSMALKRLNSLARKVSTLVLGMDANTPGWSLVAPVVLGNCSRITASAGRRETYNEQ